MILFDCERTKYPNTGLFHFCLNLGKALIENINPEKEKIFFYVPPEQKILFGSAQHYIMQHPFHKFFQPGTGKFGVWHCTNQHSQYRPFNKKVNTVLTVHDLNFLIERKDEPVKIKKYLKQIQENINRADRIVCVSRFTENHLREHLALNGRQTEIIYNGCNINEFPGFDNPAYRPQSPFLFSIGTVLPKKNFHVLPCLLQNNDYELVIAGIIDKQYQSQILQQAKLFGVENKITLTGPISEAEKHWYYKYCLAFTFPSLAEGFGFPAVEAMYYGKPVFLSTHASLPEIGGDLAYYFNDFDSACMQQTFEEGMKAYRERSTAPEIRQRALQFSWTKAAVAYLSVYRAMNNK
jgi:glycosyltransferase involved in cell wall biosynthesis